MWVTLGGVASAVVECWRLKSTLQFLRAHKIDLELVRVPDIALVTARAINVTRP